MKRNYKSPTIQVIFLSSRSKLLAGSGIKFGNPTELVDNPDDVI